MSLEKVGNYAHIMIMALLTLFAPIKAMMIATGALVVADFILGLVAALKRKESISSAGIRRTVTKMFVFQALLVLGFVVETYLTGDSVPVIKISSAFIGLTELTSILENLNEISGGNLLKALISKLGSVNDAHK